MWSVGQIRGSIGFPKSSMPSLSCRIFQIQHMTRRQPCRTAATANVIQLVQFVPFRRAILVTMSIPPGVWINIMGILKAPTSLILYVCNIWGAYWTAARRAELMPRNVAHDEICGDKAPSGECLDVERRYTVVVKRKRRWITEIHATITDRPHSVLLTRVLVWSRGCSSDSPAPISTYLRCDG